MEAYSNICGNYRVGDEIILIGYSRGAYTIRCLINLIAEVGFLTPQGLRNIHEVFDRWWKNENPIEIREAYQPWGFIEPQSPYPIKACGLWDTVSSVSYRGPDSLAPDVTSIFGVEYAFHALSLHETRSKFRPEITGDQGVPRACPRQLEQCWFNGYHGDIGGGRQDDALAHLALAWMMAKMQEYVEFHLHLFWHDEFFGSSWTIHPGLLLSPHPYSWPVLMILRRR